MHYLRAMQSRKSPLTFVFATLALAHCDRPPIQRNCENEGGIACPYSNEPSGRIEGTVIYRGPPPLERPAPVGTAPQGIASGRVVLLLFDFNNPPPPTGSATSAVSVQTINAAQLFANAVRNADGTVTATIPFQFPGISRAGVYQLRAFYSRNETISFNRQGADLQIPSGFHPIFSVRNLPVAGDVAGGALEDPNSPVARFVPIPLGDRVEENGRSRFVMPVEGAVADHVTVYIGRQLPTERPIFRIPTVETTVTRNGMSQTLAAPSRFTRTEVPPPPNASQQSTSIPAGRDLLRYASDWGLQTPGTEVLEMVQNPVIVETPLGATLPSFAALFSVGEDECFTATLGGVQVRRDCSADPLGNAMSGFVEFAADTNDNGVIDLTPASNFVDAHPSLISSSPFFAATNGRLPWIYPLVIISKLHEPNAVERRLLVDGVNGRLNAETLVRLRTALNRSETLDLSNPNDPRYPVVFFGSVVPGGASTGFLLPWTSGHRQVENVLRIVVVPFGAEVRGPNRQTDWHIIVPPQLPATAASLGRALGQAGFQNLRCSEFDPQYADDSQSTGLPPGRYSVNFVGPAGQTWAVPNELGEFPAPPGAPSDLCPRGVCRAASQSFFIRVRGTELPFAEARCPTLVPPG